AVMTVNARLFYGFDIAGVKLTLFEMRADGVIYINGEGIAGKMRLKQTRLEASNDDAPLPFIEFFDELGLGISMDANFDLILNTTREEISIVLPQHFDAFEAFDVSSADRSALEGVSGSDVVEVGLDDNLTKLTSTMKGSVREIRLILPNNPRNYVDSAAEGRVEAGEFYILIHADGMMKFPGFELSGSFDLQINEEFAVMTVNARLFYGFDIAGVKLTLFEMRADGVIYINGEGIAGKMRQRQQYQK
ncbi:hypothetical protein ACFLZG_07090, partial [Thermodesulfobacteriota bacterium]